MNIFQILMRSIQRSVLKLGHSGYYNKFSLAIKFLIRRFILKFYDPLILNQMGKFKIIFPLSHNKPIDIIANPFLSTNIARIASHTQKKYESLKIIDVGANVGDTLSLMKSMIDSPVLCIEGDNFYFSILEKNAGKFENVQIVKAVIGQQTKTTYGNMVGNYGGSKQVMEQAGSQHQLNIVTITDLLKEFPEFLNSKFFKIDTDGYDCKIIRGALTWIKKTQPIIFFEYDPHHLAEQNDDGISIFPALTDLGYDKMIIYDSEGSLMFSSSVKDKIRIEEMQSYFTGRNSRKYADICVFHSTDQDLFQIIRETELEFFKKARKQNFNQLECLRIV